MSVPAGVVGFAAQLILPQPLSVGLAMDILDGAGNSLPINAPSGAGVPVAVPVYPGIR